MIEEFLKNAKNNNCIVDSIVIEQDGNIEEKVINEYDLHELRSVSKTIVAFAYGIAINEKFTCKNGEPLSLDTKVYNTLKNLTSKNIPKEAKEWTIWTLMTHSTGYDRRFFHKDDKEIDYLDKYKLLDVLFEEKIKYPPNTHFCYSNHHVYLLSIFFKENFGINISDFVNERIFKPLGITKYKWTDYGNYCAGCTGLFLNYKDFHKIGQLFYNYGHFNGKEIVPEWWIKEMISPQILCPSLFKRNATLPYVCAGFLCFYSKNGIYFTAGNNHQYIICDHMNNRLITIFASTKNNLPECLKKFDIRYFLLKFTKK